MVRLVNDDDAPEIRSHLFHQATAVHRIDHGKQMFVLVGRVFTVKNFTKGGVAQNLSKC